MWCCILHLTPYLYLYNLRSNPLRSNQSPIIALLYKGASPPQLNQGNKADNQRCIFQSLLLLDVADLNRMPDSRFNSSACQKPILTSPNSLGIMSFQRSIVGIAKTIAAIKIIANADKRTSNFSIVFFYLKLTRLYFV